MAVADGLAVPGRIALVLGGDCTIGIGTVAGARSALGDVGLLYFDLHADLNTPASAGDGALDWMALAHMLAIPGSEPSLAEATGRVPIIDPARVVLFGHGRAQATGGRSFPDTVTGASDQGSVSRAPSVP